MTARSTQLTVGHRSRSRTEKADTLVEVLVGVGLVALVFATLFGGMATSTGVTEAAREDLRATQIMVERMEGIRLFNWNQLVYSNTLCPSTFTASYLPIVTGSSSTGITYYGTMVITNVPFTQAVSYSNQMRAIIVTLNWTNFGVARSRTMTTYQAMYGVQNYIFND